MPGRQASPQGKKGRAQSQSQVMPPYKEAKSRHSSTSPRSMKAGAHGSARGLVDITNKQERPAWHASDARAFHERADQRNVKSPLLDDRTRLAIARTKLAANELQLRIESRRFEVAQVQLQVQVEKTSTAKAKLAVEKTRRQICQLDIELEQKQVAAPAVKSERDSARDAARQSDLDRQTAICLLKKEAAQLQLDARQERGTSDVDVEFQRQETARTYIGLEQARVRNKRTAAARSEADAALIQLGVVSPAPCIEEEELAVQLQCTCGFSSDEPADVGSHLRMHAREAAPQRAQEAHRAALQRECGQLEERVNQLEVLADAHAPQQQATSALPLRKRSKKRRGNCKQEGHDKQETDRL